MNKGTLIGYISSDIKSETINLKSGETMAKAGFNIACQRKGKGAGADFPRVTAIGKTAEIVSQYFHKSKGIIVEYHVQTGSYQNKEGKTIYTTDLMVDSVEFLPISKADEENSTPVNSPNSDTSPDNDTNTENNQPSAPDNNFIDIPDGIEQDLPFR
ncbi:MAG: single-stranded DNA-binding protein [Methanobrevibacter sp.]|nr:single-stranded DNA-binding protein [Methanobrevibacter sp.]